MKYKPMKRPASIQEAADTVRRIVKKSGPVEMLNNRVNEELKGYDRAFKVLRKMKEGPKPLFIPLKAEFYDAFANGTKDVEYRVYGPRWNENTCYLGRAVTISYGYGKSKPRLHGYVSAFYTSSVPCKTEAWKTCYGDKAGVAACIQITLTTLPNQQ